MVGLTMVIGNKNGGNKQQVNGQRGNSIETEGRGDRIDGFRKTTISEEIKSPAERLPHISLT